MSRTRLSNIRTNNEIASGRLRAIRSRITSFSTWPVCVPRTNIVVRGSSTSFGSRASRARFARAFFGLIVLSMLLVQRYKDWTQATSRASLRLARRRSFATAVDVGGFKVAAIENNQPTVAVTVLAKAGPRYQQKPGVAHALKNFAFKSTADRSALGTVRESELYGGVLSSTLTREHLALTAEFLRGDEEFFINVLASVIASTKYYRHEYEELVLPAVESEVNALHRDPATHAIELAHALAFRNGLGASLFAAPHTPVTATDVEQFAASAFAKGNFAILGSGISQSALSSLLQHAPTSQSTSSAPTTAPSSYSGGESRLETHGLPQTIFIGYGTTGAPTPELAALAAHLDPNPSVKWAKSASPILVGENTTAQAVYLPYSDAALVGLLVQGPTAAGVREAAKAAVAAIKGTSGVKAEQLKSAVAKAKFRLAANADGRAGIVEVLGSKVLAGSSETSLDAAIASLDKVSSAGFTKAAGELIKGKPTYVAIGDTQALPYADELGL
ncbi:peptidase-M16 domain-containing protein [Favolaschia claudopus]|uniref:Cytochrome b-c1 complex subunit 2, mitochondrial n=1 Tax=Favolaschia claudopus TaxID=2862362 RepID=A0AAW0BV25_9AGAR